MMRQGRFHCDIFGPWDPGRSSPGSLEIARDAFLIVLEDGRSFSLSTSRAKLSRGGFDNLHILVEGQAESGEALYASIQEESFLDSLAAQGSVDLRLAANDLSRQGSNTQTWIMGAFLVSIAFVVGIAIFVWSCFGYLVNSAVALVPPSLETSLGEIVVSSFTSGNKELKQGPIFDAANKVWGRVLQGVPAAQPYKLHLYVIDGPNTVNAFAAPGGHVIVFTGLMKELESPEELAGIIGHELQHVLMKHPLKSIVRSAGFAIVVSILLGDTSGLAAIIAEYGPELARLSYSREQEREADRGAVDLLVKAKIDPMKFPEFFRRMQAHGEGMPSTLTMISTHPGHEERDANLQKIFSGLKGEKYIPISVDWASVRSAIPAAKKP